MYKKTQHQQQQASSVNFQPHPHPHPYVQKANPPILHPPPSLVQQGGGQTNPQQTKTKLNIPVLNRSLSGGLRGSAEIPRTPIIPLPVQQGGGPQRTNNPQENVQNQNQRPLPPGPVPLRGSSGQIGRISPQRGGPGGAQGPGGQTGVLGGLPKQGKEPPDKTPLPLGRLSNSNSSEKKDSD